MDQVEHRSAHVRQRRHAASYAVALRTLPYALPFTVGLVVLTWGVLDLTAVYAAPLRVVLDFVPPILSILAGSGFLLFGGIGAISVAIRTAQGS